MSSKKQRTTPTYELLYWPGMPGRGEFIRLAFEAASVPYKDVSNETPDGVKEILPLIDEKYMGEGDNPTIFAPPALRIPGARPDGSALMIHQTSVILSYIARDIGMVPENDIASEYHVAQLASTALDWNNEAHDTHHPIESSLYYEDQKTEALRKAGEFRAKRIPKFLNYFERVLSKNEARGGGRYLVGGGLTYADTTLWQVVDGLHFAFPKEMAARKEEFPLVFGTFYPSVKEEKGIKEYLASDRRKPYSMGVFRYYPELDRQ